MHRFSRNGFTLIEIMVVVAIIGTLLGLVSWKVLSSQQGANLTATRAKMANIRTAIELYKLDQKKLPKELKDLISAPANHSDGYIDEDQLRDAWGNPIQFSVPGKNDRPYDLVSYGADGAAGGEKENADFSMWDTDAAKPKT